MKAGVDSAVINSVEEEKRRVLDLRYTMGPDYIKNDVIEHIHNIRRTYNNVKTNKKNLPCSGDILHSLKASCSYWVVKIHDFQKMKIS